MTYEYQCPKCGHEWEAEQKITAEPLRECPKCGAIPKRLVSAAPFALKGEGWARDGYR